MADHVAVGVVDHDQVVALLLDGLDDAVGDFRRAHFRLEVVGGDVRRGDEDAFLALERLFPAAGEEEGDVGVLLGFGDAQLGLALLGQVFAKHIGQGFGLEGAGRRDARGVLGEHDEAGQLRDAAAGECSKVRLDEGAGQLAGTVGAEIHEHHGIAIRHRGRRAYHRGLDELVAFAAFVGGGQAGAGVIGQIVALAVDDQLVGLLDPVPAVVAVHGEVAADQAGDAPLAELGERGVEQFDGRLGALWWSIAAVEKGVQVDPLGATLGRQLGHGGDVLLVAVHAAVGQQAEDVHRLAGAYRLIDRATDGRIVEELAVANGLGHPGEVLVHDAAGAEVHMADLGVAHLPVRQAHVHAAAGDQTMGLGGAQVIVHRRVGSVDGVVLGAVAVAEAIEDDQYQGFGRGAHKAGSLCLRGTKRPGILRPSGTGVTARRGLADLWGCVYWPAFYRPGTAQCLPT